MNTTQRIVLELLKSSLLNEPMAPLAIMPSEQIDWDDVLSFMVAHAIVPIAWQSAKKDLLRQMPRQTLARLTSISINSFATNEYLLSAQHEILQWFAQENVCCAILKGSSVAVCYPQPALRSLGDIDMLVEAQKLQHAVQVLTQNGYNITESEHAFHVGLHKDTVYVELHRAISDIPENTGGQRIRSLLSDTFDYLSERTLHGYSFPTLLPRHQALSLLLHMERHMMNGGIGLRQLVDFDVFVMSTDPRVWHDEIAPALTQSGLYQFAKVLMHACVVNLGANAAHVPWCLDIDDRLAANMMMDILESGNFGKCFAERSTSSLLLNESTDDHKDLPLLFSKRSKINRDIQKRYLLCKKLPVLLVFFWIFLPLRYWVRSLFGKREKQSTLKVVKTAAVRNKLYNELRLFKVTNNE